MIIIMLLGARARGLAYTNCGRERARAHNAIVEQRATGGNKQQKNTSCTCRKYKVRTHITSFSCRSIVSRRETFFQQKAKKNKKRRAARPHACALQYGR